MSRLAECLVYLCIILALFAGAKFAGAQERTWMLQTLDHGAVTWRDQLPAAVPYADCVAAAGRMARYYNHTMAFNQPEVRCNER